MTKCFSNPKQKCELWKHFVIFRFFIKNSLKELRLADSSSLGENIHSQIVPLFKTTKTPNEKLLYSTDVCSGNTQTDQIFTKYVLIISYCIVILPFLQAVEMILYLFIFSTFLAQNCSRKEKKGLNKC